MSFESSLETHLANDAGVAALVGTRIRPEVIAQRETLPAITHTSVSSTHEHNLGGATGVCHSRVQLDCYAATKAEAIAVREAVRLALVGYRGTIGDVFVNGVLVERKFSSTDAPEDGSDNWRYVEMIEFLITHSESTQ